MNGSNDRSPRRLATPQEAGQALLDPPLRGMCAMSRESFSRFAANGVPGREVAGVSLTQLAAQARASLVRAAWEYTTAYREVRWNATSLMSETANAPIVMAGHQPQLFHCGVWFKNYLLHRLASDDEPNKIIGAAPIAINLQIDNDLLRTPTIVVPAWRDGRPRVEHAPLDDSPTGAQVSLPYEERRVVDPAFVGELAARLKRQMGAALGDDVIIYRLQPLLSRFANANGARLGEAVAKARHALEGEWGWQTLELPLSRVVDGRPFQTFVAAMLIELPKLAAQYNASLREYRRRHRLRSQNHPATELMLDVDGSAAAGEGWLEAPLWVWTEDDPRRGRLFLRRRGGCWQLSNRKGWQRCLDAGTEPDAAKLADQLAEWRAAGVKIRPRALITTLFSRLFLSDTFVHGIGGAAYDEATDDLALRWLQTAPPPYATATATLRLPIALPNVSQTDLRRIDALLRNLRYHAERHVAPEIPNSDAALAELIEAKRRWVAAEPPRAARRERHEEITRINEAMQVYVEPLREKLLGEREQTIEMLRDRRILASREYAFCLHSEAQLREAFERMLTGR